MSEYNSVMNYLIIGFRLYEHFRRQAQEQSPFPDICQPRYSPPMNQHPPIHPILKKDRKKEEPKNDS